MAQIYPAVDTGATGDTVRNGIIRLLERTDSLKSGFSGNAFPVANLEVGLECYRIDQSRRYQLKAIQPVTWIEIPDIVRGEDIYASRDLSNVPNDATLSDDLREALRGLPGEAGRIGIDGADGAKSGVHYDFDVDTSSADPLNGHMKFSNATAANITSIFITGVNRDDIDITNFINVWDDASSSIKGYLIIESNSNSDPKTLVFRINGATIGLPTHYEIAVEYISGTLSFTDNEHIIIQFYRTGDRGSTDNAINLVLGHRPTGFTSTSIEDLLEWADGERSGAMDTAPGIPSAPSLVSRTQTSLSLRTAAGSGGTPTLYRWRYSTNSTISDTDPMVTSTGPTVNITGLTSGTSYWIDVRAENAEGESAYSGDLATSTGAPIDTAPGIPSAPSLVSRTQTSLSLRTAAGSGGTPTLYRWRYSTNSTITDTDPILTTTGPTVTIPNLDEDSNYWIDVRAENAEGESAYSGDLATSTLGSSVLAPGVPNRPSLVSRGLNNLSLSTAAGSGGTPTLYRWRYSLNDIVSNSDPMVTSTGPTVNITGLTSGTSYWIDVRAENAEGESAYSNNLPTATTSTPTPLPTPKQPTPPAPTPPAPTPPAPTPPAPTPPAPTPPAPTPPDPTPKDPTPTPGKPGEFAFNAIVAFSFDVSGLIEKITKNNNTVVNVSFEQNETNVFPPSAIIDSLIASVISATFRTNILTIRISFERELKPVVELSIGITMISGEASFTFQGFVDSLEPYTIGASEEYLTFLDGLQNGETLTMTLQYPYPYPSDTTDTSDDQ